MDKIEAKSNLYQDSAAIVSPQGIRGKASGIDSFRSRGKSSNSSLGKKQNLKFFVGELLGLLFILATTAYILVLPAKLAKAGELRNLFNCMIKRSIDILAATVGLILTAPVWLILPILIKIDSPGSVFYSQVRVGVNRRKGSRRFHQKTNVRCNRSRDRRRNDLMGRPFEVLKFRTMVSDAEKKSGPVWATKNDPRITRLGSFMRKTRLDEIPQFINILVGDMSLVGPRPERPNFVLDLSQKVENYSNRLEMKPGLTGLAQVENGYDSSLDSVIRKVRFDIQYIRNWSVLSDIKIILKTFVVVVTGKGAC